MGNLGSLSFLCENTGRCTHKSPKKNKKVDGMEADNRRAIIDFFQEVIYKTTILEKISHLYRRTPRTRPGKLCTERKHKEKTY